MAGLTQAFRASTDRTGFCALGSVKANVGHLEIAAGVTGVIKTVLALRNGQLPPSANYTRPNPAIDFESSPFYVNSALTDWKTGTSPRRAGVSAFGVGGTNAHVILEEAPSAEPSSPEGPCQLLLLSAKTASALDSATANLAEHLRRNPGINLSDAAYTLQIGRRAFAHRRAIVCEGREDALRVLESLDPKRAFSGLHDGRAPGGHRSVAFLFPGQGAQSVGMAAGLYETEPGFRRRVDYCASLLNAELGLDLRCILYPKDEERATALQVMDQTRVTQPALFVVEYALAQWWLENGVQPRAMLGHSIGEYVAACLAGVFTVEDALRLLAARGRLVQELPGGTMLAVRRSEADVRHLLDANVCLAAVNGPASVVLSGPDEALAAVQSRLAAEGVACRRLKTSHAFHSSMLDPILEEFRGLVRSIELQAPRIPYLSNVTGTWIAAEEATDPDYWVRHLRETVHFAEGVQALFADPELALLEVGPGRVLSTLARQQGGRTEAIFASLGSDESAEHDLVSLNAALGRLWLCGVEPDWDAAHEGQRRHRIPLPTYPFERKRHWREPVASRRQGAAARIPEDERFGAAIPSEVEICPAPQLFGREAKRPSVLCDDLTVRPGGNAPLPAQEMNMGNTTVVAREQEAAAGEMAPATGLGRLVAALKTLLQEASGTDLADVDPAASFLEMGFDSLFLTQACLIFQREFKVKITFRQLMGDLSSFGALAGHIERSASAEVLARYAEPAGVLPGVSRAVEVQLPPPGRPATARSPPMRIADRPLRRMLRAIQTGSRRHRPKREAWRPMAPRIPLDSDGRIRTHRIPAAAGEQITPNRTSLPRRAPARVTPLRRSSSSSSGSWRGSSNSSGRRALHRHLPRLLRRRPKATRSLARPPASRCPLARALNRPRSRKRTAIWRISRRSGRINPLTRAAPGPCPPRSRAFWTRLSRASRSEPPN